MPPLAYLHGCGLVHRDLKPGNVFIRSNGTVVLGDFGVATEFGGAYGREVLQVDGGGLGTLLYMAPEQIRGDLVDARADLYSLGCILYECVTGFAPFMGGSSRIHPPAPPPGAAHSALAARSRSRSRSGWSGSSSSSSRSGPRIGWAMPRT